MLDLGIWNNLCSLLSRWIEPFFSLFFWGAW